MKIIKLLQNKTFITLTAVALAVVIVAVSALAIMIPSYTSWKAGYDAAMQDREHQKYLQSLPLELVGISAALADNVVYYDNGKAAPANSDFDVTAHYTEKGKEFDEILKPGAFEIAVPDDFARSGGTVAVSYAFTPDAKEGEAATPEPVVKTAEVACSLEKVVPVSVVMTERPYRVTYSDAMSFDSDGLAAEVKFNDGSTETVTHREFTAGEAKLAAGTASVTVNWRRGGTELPLSVPVTVVAAQDYKDGYVISLKAEGTVYLAEGALTSTAEPVVRATYDNGNRLLLTADQYQVSGNTERATFTKKCLLSVFLKNNPAIFYRTAAIVRSGIEAESATLTGAESAETEEFIYDGNGYVSAGTVTAVTPQKGAKINFVLSSGSVAKPDLSMRVAVKSADVCLADVMTMKVNGRTVVIPRAATVSAPEGADGKTVFSQVSLPSAVLNKNAANSVEFAFNGDAASELVIDSILLEAGYRGEFYSSTEAYLVAQSAGGSATAEFDNEMVKSWGTVSGKPYGHSICSDGTYLYIAATTYSSPLRSIKVQKYDPATNTVVAASTDTETAATEATAGITYYDDKIIVYMADGRKMYVDVDKFTDGCVFKEYDGFVFEGLETAVLKDVYYNSAKQTFAVFAGGSVYLYGKDMQLLTSFATAGDTGTARRVTGSAEYIYVSYTKDGQYSPVVRIYDWNGNAKGRLIVPVAADFLTSGGVNDLTKTNVQGMAVVNGDFYAILLKFGAGNGGDASAYIKIRMPEISEELEPDLTFGEYLTACGDANAAPAFTASPSTGNIGQIPDTSGYAMGGVSDGKYLYLATNKNGNSTTVIHKVDPATYTIVAASLPFSVGSAVAATDNSRLFIKDGTLYCVAGDVFSISLAKFGARCELSKDDKMTALLSDGANVLKSAYWNGAAGKFAVMTAAGKLTIIDGEGKRIGEETSLARAGYTASSVYGDENYIYVSYKNNFQPVLPIDVFTWDGVKVRTLEIPGIDLGTYVAADGKTPQNNYNIQAVYTHNGQLHASVCTWTNASSTVPTAYYDWTLKADLSVLYTA